jgi:subtilisin family serine protease
MNFEPGELIVKLKDQVDAGVTYTENGKAISDFNIGEFLGIEDKIESSDVMFHKKGIEASINNSKVLSSKFKNNFSSLKNIFLIKLNNSQENILQLVNQLNNNPSVEYAEPNYIYSIDDYEVGDVITSEEAKSMSTDVTIDVDDPLYSSQTNITTTNIDDVWDQYTTGDGSQVIAILDTGGDYTHPDLEANTWINTAELNGVEGYDDDGNGYVDDIRGWDFIHSDNAPLDDNMHGTHVAGIAGAVGDNGIGIAGAVWNVKLMHIKVFQASGFGNTSQISEGVEYAYSNGATILNMSFASATYSQTLRDMLATAYSTSMLVAAAGNSGSCIEGPGCHYFYPAAFRFVLGVQEKAGWSNFDNNGPYLSLHTDLRNYEVTAPGVDIISTVPNGGYATLTGTSMAAPLVAGAVALYAEIEGMSNKEILFGDFINSSPYVDGAASSGSQEFLDLYSALNIVPESNIRIYNVDEQDDNENNIYINSIVDASETIDIYAHVRNYWALSGDIIATIEFGGNQSQSDYYSSLCTITDNSSELVPLSDYGVGVNNYDPFTVVVNEDVPDGVEIEFVIKAWDENFPDKVDTVNHKMRVTNMITLQGPITEDLTLTEGAYLINEPVHINGEGVTLTIDPGVTLYFQGYVPRLKKINGSIILAEGTAEKNINFIWRQTQWYVEEVKIAIDSCNFCNFSAEDVGWNASAFFKLLSEDWQTTPSTYRNSNLYNVVTFSNTIVTHSNIYLGHWDNNPPVENMQYNNIYKGQIRLYHWDDGNEDSYQNLITTYLYGSDASGELNSPNIFAHSNEGGGGDTYLEGFFHNIPYELNIFYDLLMFDATSAEYVDDNWDFFHSDLMATEPYEEAPAVGWKVEINGKKAMSQLNSWDDTNGVHVPYYPPENYFTEALGVGTYEFKVYFNKEMNTSIHPTFTYGIADPWTQKYITEEGSWSADGKVYTVNHEINLGATDGVNRLIITGAKDLDNHEIVRVDLYQFHMSSAGTASTGWFATPGLGKIALEWEAPSSDELDDVLGYNMYRYQVDGDGNESDPVKLNESLIVEDTDESTTGVYYTDFDVTEGETYFYKYKILRTSFEETDYSNAVSASPLTSTLGDSNGDFSVDVLDLVHDVDYILGNNPTPFIFVAGDVNADQTINVLDIVGTVDIILSDDGDSSTNSQNINFYPSLPIGYATFSWEGNDLYVESDHNIGGIQLAFDQDFEYVLSEMPGIERLDYQQEDLKILMLYSFNNTTIASNRTKLLTRINQAQEINIDLAVVGTTSGSKLTPVFDGSDLDDIDAPLQSSQLEFLSMIPNPSDGVVTLTYYLPEQMDGVVAKVYDMLGRLVWIQPLQSSEGQSQTQMQLDKLQAGNYIVLISANKQGGLKYLSHKILIIQ